MLGQRLIAFAAGSRLENPALQAHKPTQYRRPDQHGGHEDERQHVAAKSAGRAARHLPPPPFVPLESRQQPIAARPSSGAAERELRERPAGGR